MTVTFGGGGGVTGGGHAWSSGVFQCFSSPPGWLCTCLLACMFVCVIYFLQLGGGGKEGKSVGFAKSSAHGPGSREFHVADFLPWAEPY